MAANAHAAARTCLSSLMPRRSFSGLSSIGRRLRSSLFQRATHVRLRQLERRGVTLEAIEQDGQTDLMRLSRHLFSVDPPPERDPTGELVWFSAPGEGREMR